MDEEMQRYINDSFADLQRALVGLPFTLTDRTPDIDRGFFDVSKMVDGEIEDVIGFVGHGYTTGGWFGGYFHGADISPRLPSARAALVWVLSQYISEVIGD